MESIYILLIFVVGIIIAIGIGIQISQGIEDFLLKFLFWLLYLISIITFINIILVINYYISLKDKRGLQGPQGEIGERGEKGEVGKCDVGCRDSICTKQLTDLLDNELKNLNSGVSIKINNVYIKSKITQICQSPEFRQLAPYNGPQNLLNYIKNIWKIWIKLLYDAGGVIYFETIGAEDNFNWMAENPFNEIKKYDIFYWGMGKQYRPQIIEKCYETIDGNTPINNGNGSMISVSKTDLYDAITNDTNSGAFSKVSFWRAKQFTYKGAVFFPVGDIAIGPTRHNDDSNTNRHIGLINYPYPSKGPARETIIIAGDVKGPINYELLWTNYGSIGRGRKIPNFFWIWRPIAPAGYIALGDIITTSADPPNTGDNAPIRCPPIDFTIRIPNNNTILWASNGSTVENNVNIIGFVPNTENSGYSSSSDTNAYNLFRAVVGFNTNIPESDTNGNFYYINPEMYDTTFDIGKTTGSADPNNNSNRVGKGYIYPSKIDAKYSIIAYMNLKNNPILKHNITGLELKGQLIPNAISNCYILKLDNKCIDFENGNVVMGNCDELRENQYFAIIFNGIVKNQCTLQHIITNKILKYNDDIFTFTDSSNNDDYENTIFIMQ
jgi:hypothetical protein